MGDTSVSRPTVCLTDRQTDPPRPRRAGRGGCPCIHFSRQCGSRHSAPTDDCVEFTHPGQSVRCAVGDPPPRRPAVPEGPNPMASLSRQPNGNYIIQLVGTDSKRRSIRLGAVNKKTANEVKLKVETLHTLRVANLPMDAVTA